MSENTFDLIVIGAGPGGYICAIRAAQLGLSVACVESRETLGGTCLNVGCIPSKALLESSEFYHKVAHQAGEYGVKVEKSIADIPAMIQRKSSIVQKYTKGIEGLFKKNKITHLRGFGSFVDANTVQVLGADKSTKTYKAKNIVIATGSEPIELSIAKFDGKNIVSSTEALEFTSAPKHLIVIGGGVIGLELGSVWARLGSKVTVIEAAPALLANMDLAISRAMTKFMTQQGLSLEIGTKVTAVTASGNKVTVSAQNSEGKNVDFSGDIALVCVGRRAFTKDLNLSAVGITPKANGKIEVNNHWQTSHPHIYAVGDVIDGLMLAHKAEEEGVAVAETIAGKAGHVNYRSIPNVIYTWPEVASVGLTEEECKKQSIAVRVGQFPFVANARSACSGTTDGFVKLIADAKTDLLIGAHIVGPHASELIAEIVIGFEFSASAEDIARSVHAHPTLTEAVREAALALDKRSLSM